MFLQVQPGNKPDQIRVALRNLPQIPGQQSPPLKEEEIRELAELQTSNDEYLFDPDNVLTFYQLVSTILQLKYGEEQFTRLPGDPPTEPSARSTVDPGLSSGERQSVKGIEFEGALQDLNKVWIFPEEAVHGSKLLQPTRNKIQRDILRAEEEPIVEEGHITCERPGCPSRRISRTELQTRGSDESSTRFFLCTTCGYRWTN